MAIQQIIFPTAAGVVNEVPIVTAVAGNVTTLGYSAAALNAVANYPIGSGSYTFTGGTSEVVTYTLGTNLAALLSAVPTQGLLELSMPIQFSISSLTTATTLKVAIGTNQVDPDLTTTYFQTLTSKNGYSFEMSGNKLYIPLSVLGNAATTSLLISVSSLDSFVTPLIGSFATSALVTTYSANVADTFV